MMLPGVLVGGLDVASRVEPLAVPSVQLGLVVERVNLAHAAVHEELDHPAGSCAMVQSAIELGPWPERLARRPREQAFLAEQPGQGNAPQASAQPPEKIATCVMLGHGSFRWQMSDSNDSWQIPDGRWQIANLVHEQELVAIEENPAQVCQAVLLREISQVGQLLGVGRPVEHQIEGTAKLGFRVGAALAPVFAPGARSGGGRMDCGGEPAPEAGCSTRCARP